MYVYRASIFFVNIFSICLQIMSGKIKIGIIGAGRMAYWHLKGYKKIPGVEIVGIAGRTETSVRYLMKKFNVSRGYTDYRKLLGEQKLDAVSITTPTATHCTITIDCLNAGAHVLCEKPLALSLEDVDLMIAAEQKNGRLLMPGFSQRFFKEFMHMKRIIDEGKIGSIRAAWFRRGINLPAQKWYSDKNKTRGVTCELAIHAIDWLRWIIDSPVVRVSAEVTESTSCPGIDDNSWIFLKFQNNAIGVVGASYYFPFLKRDIGVIGEKMALTIERCKVIVEPYGSHSLGHMALKYLYYSLIIPYWLYYNPFESELRNFIGSISGRNQPMITSKEGRINLAIALAALDSAKTGEKVNFCN